MKINRYSFFLLVITLLLVLTSGCAPKRYLVNSYGLSFIRIGDEMPAPGTYEFKRFPILDSIAQEEDFSWRVAELISDDGPVYLEEGFFGETTLNRIRIENPKFHLRNGLQVGSTIADLHAASKQWYISPLPKYKVYDFYTKMMPRVHFLVPDLNEPLAEKDQEFLRIQDFQPDSKVIAIVIH